VTEIRRADLVVGVTLSELRLEAFVPADEDTASVLRARA
jgi:hypothetical protein